MRYLTISDAISSGLIPEDYAEIFRRIEKCDKCGHDIFIPESLGPPVDFNPLCFYSIVNRTLSFITSFGVEGISDKTIKRLVEKYDLQSPLHFLSIPEEIARKEKLPEKAIEKLIQIRNSKVALPVILQFLGIRNLKKRIFEISRRVDLLTLDPDDVEHLAKLFYEVKRVVGGSGTLQDEIVNTILTFLPEIKLIPEVIPKVKTSQNTRLICIAITGTIFYKGKDWDIDHRDELLNRLNTETDFLFYFTNSVDDNCLAVIAENPSRTEKYIKGQRRGILETSFNVFLEKLKRGDI